MSKKDKSISRINVILVYFCPIHADMLGLLNRLIPNLREEGQFWSLLLVDKALGSGISKVNFGEEKPRLLRIHVISIFDTMATFLINPLNEQAWGKGKKSYKFHRMCHAIHLITESLVCMGALDECSSRTHIFLYSGLFCEDHT